MNTQGYSKTIYFCKSPYSDKWIGWIIKDNAHYWGSGRTLDDLVMHVKNTLYSYKQCSTAGYILDTKPTPIEEVPLDKMSKMFYTKGWMGGPTKAQEIREQQLEASLLQPTEEKVEYDYYDSKFEGDELVVYGVIRREVARYKRDPNRKPYKDYDKLAVPFNVLTNGDKDGQQ